MSHPYELTPRGPFDLALQQRAFGSWPLFEPEPGTLAMAFPVEGWIGSAAVLIRQPSRDRLTATVHGANGALADRAWQQALAVLSLDVDGSGFPGVGEADPVIGRIGSAHSWMRPVLFHSPYEAACNFIIGQRISMAQALALRLRMAADSGDGVTADGVTLHAFPRPQQLLLVTEVRGLPAEKLARLHGVARAALDGILDRDRLRALPVAAALAELGQLRGVGLFSSQGILYRGAGLVDEITDDEVGKQAVQRLYDLDHLPSHAEVLELAERWRPYRMWALVLLHVWIRGDGGGLPPRRRRTAQDARPG